ncbi:hypothetical protein [Caloramator sp. mosi_1]|uniref:hypothetical protein n=1 Tax=Caloramator sp. mosi_1 TaxID=3023090 RepID=UPI0030821498
MMICFHILKGISKVFESKNEYKIESSDVWYEERKDFSKNSLGTGRVKHTEKEDMKFCREKEK